MKQLWKAALCLALLVSLAALGGAAPARADSLTIPVYFNDALNWGNPYVYYWGSDQYTPWPGIAMTQSGSNSYGKIYKADIPADAMGILFSDGKDSKQTVDIDSNAMNGAGWRSTSQTDGMGHYKVVLYQAGTAAPTPVATATPKPTATPSPTPVPTYSITLPAGVTAKVGNQSSATSAHSGDAVSLTISTAAGYAVDQVKYNDGSDHVIAPVNGAYSFTMPAKNVTVTVTFKPDSAHLSVSGSEYTIKTAAGWGVFCDMIVGGETFSGKTVKLGAGISVSRMAGDKVNSKAFKGAFNGQGNTLTFTCTAADIYTAPFPYADGASFTNLKVNSTITCTAGKRHIAGLVALQTGVTSITNVSATVTISSTGGGELYPAALVSQAASDGTLTITGCAASGSIATDGKYAGGMVGVVQGGATITDCVCSVTINSSTSGDGTHGGFVAVHYGGTLTIEGCVFNGKLLGANTHSCGGFIGYRKSGANIYDSLFIPAQVTVQNENSAPFSRNNVDTYNCYFTTPMNNGADGCKPTLYDGNATPRLFRNGQQAYAVAGGENVTVNLGGTTTAYTHSGITAGVQGLVYNGTLYAGTGDSVTLSLDCQVPKGYVLDHYAASAGEITGTESPYTLVLPAAITGNTVTVSASIATNPDFSINADGTYSINTETGWELFCDALLDSDAYNGFSGKTVKLGSSITINRMAGDSTHKFAGTFNGGGNTLTLDFGAAGNPVNGSGDDDNFAPFRYTDGATIKELNVNGYVHTKQKHFGGIIGLASGTTNLTNCHSSVHIISYINGDGTHGGLIACTWTGSTTNITGCVFDGAIQSASDYTTDQCGGFVGWRNSTINVKNSLMAADLSTIVDADGLKYPSATFVRNGAAGAQYYENSYYTVSLGTVQGTQIFAVSKGGGVTSLSAETSYANGVINHGGALYAKEGAGVSLTLSHSEPQTGFVFTGYAASAGVLSGSDNPYTLTMPGGNVTVTASFMQTYSVTVAQDIENGTVTADKESAVEGDDITLTVAPNPGCALESLIVDGADVTGQVSDGEYAITMPAHDVAVTAVFAEIPVYSVTVAQDIENGTVTADKESAVEGDDITLTVAPNQGYALESLTVDGVDVTDQVSDGEYAFTMPAHNVTVTAAFAELPVSYYVCGSMTNWRPNPDYQLTDAGSGVYTFKGLELTADSKFKIVSSTDGVNMGTWYPNGGGNDYGERGEITADGVYDVSFRPDGQGGDGWFHGFMLVTLKGAFSDYYLTGDFINWAPLADYRFLTVPGQEDTYRLTTALEEGWMIKVCNADGNQWYPDEMGYTVPEKYAGEVTITFSPERWHREWAAFGGYFNIEKDSTAGTAVILEASPQEGGTIEEAPVPQPTGKKVFTQAFRVTPNEGYYTTGVIYQFDDGEEENAYYNYDNIFSITTDMQPADGYTRLIVTAVFERITTFCTPDFTLPSGLTAIEASAFEGVAAEIVEIPEGCTSIGDYAFRNCENLSQIRIPESVTSFGTGIFFRTGDGLIFVFGAAGSGAEAYCQNCDYLVFVPETRD